MEDTECAPVWVPEVDEVASMGEDVLRVVSVLGHPLLKQLARCLLKRWRLPFPLRLQE